jgi:predicted phosphodiesterase
MTDKKMKYAFISDIHEDVVSLRLALKKIEKLGCDKIICLGDISGFSARNHHFIDVRNAKECLNLVSKECEIVLVGNHDLLATQRIPHESNIFDFPDNWYALDYHQKKELAGKTLWKYNDELDPLYAQDDIELLKKYPETSILDCTDYLVFLSHYIYPNTSGVGTVFYSDVESTIEHKELMIKNQCKFAFCGHRHYLGLYVVNEKVVTRHFNRAYKLKEHSIVMIPPIVREKHGHGFCIFDTKEETVVAKKI